MFRCDLIGAWQRPQQAVSAGRPLNPRWRWTRSMMVLGADTHKRSHTIAAVAAGTGELRGEKTVQVGARGFGALLIWARELGSERVRPPRAFLPTIPCLRASRNRDRWDVRHGRARAVAGMSQNVS